MYQNRSCFEFTRHEYNSILWTNTGMAIMATLVTGFFVILFIAFRAYATFVHRLSLYLSIAAFVNSVVFTLHLVSLDYKCGHVVVKYTTACEAQGFLVLYCIWLILLLTCWITLHLFVLAVFKRNYKSCVSEVVGMLVCCMLPLAFAVIPFIDLDNGTMYGLSGAWCWIKTTNENCTVYRDGIAEQFALLYGPGLILVILIFVATLVVLIVLYRGTKEAPSVYYSLRNQYKEALKEAVPLIVYPIIFNVLFFMSFISRVHYAATRQASFPIWLTHAIVDPCLPLFVPIALLLHPYALRQINCCCVTKSADKWTYTFPYEPSVDETCNTTATDEEQRLLDDGMDARQAKFTNTSGYQSYQSFLSIN